MSADYTLEVDVLAEDSEFGSKPGTKLYPYGLPRDESGKPLAPDGDVDAAMEMLLAEAHQHALREGEVNGVDGGVIGARAWRVKDSKGKVVLSSDEGKA